MSKQNIDERHEMNKSSADIASALLKKAEVAKASSEPTKTKATTKKKEEKFKLSKTRSVLEQALELTPQGIELDSDSIREIPILYEGNKSRFVYGEGNKSADIMFVGEAPGYDEDEQGRPFVESNSDAAPAVVVARHPRHPTSGQCGRFLCTKRPENIDSTGTPANLAG